MDGEESLPRLLSGRYRLEAELGHGGMGVVYRASDLMMKRPVAVKLIRAADGVALDEEVAGRFLREAKNTARIQQEHIIEVFDLGRSETGDLYMVMELLEGESLSVKLRREGRMTPPATVHVGRQICDALDVAHNAGIIHRDLKPANVMLVRRGPDDAFVKVLDFGVAKSYSPDQETQLTHTGMLVGTVEYMAPEQIMGKVVDGRTDIYSLGVVLYRMLLGRPPFKDGGVPAMIHHHLNVMPKPLHELVPDVPGELDRVVLRCLAKRPEQRYETMAELARALRAALEPSDLGLVSLEYADSDPYSIGDKTEIAHASSPGLLPDLAAEPDSESGLGDPYDDATMKMDRVNDSLGDSQRMEQPPVTRRPRPAAGASFDETALLPREELSGTKRSVCAMCQTPNALYARACVACGVSLAPDEQDAVRARVTAPPRTVHLPAPQMPPPTTGAYPSGGHAPPFGPGGHWSPPHGYPGAAPPRPPSVWERFLSWTGLKSR